MHFVPSLQSAFCTQSAFRTRSAVCTLHFVPTGFALLFLFEGASSPNRNIGARKYILVRLSWPLWLMCGLYVEELPRTSTIMEQWLLYTNWRRTLPRLNNMAASDTLLRDHSVLKWARYGSPRCRHFGFSIQVAFLEIRNCNLCLLSLSNPTNILFFSAWISELHRN